MSKTGLRKAKITQIKNGETKIQNQDQFVIITILSYNVENFMSIMFYGVMTLLNTISEH